MSTLRSIALLAAVFALAGCNRTMGPYSPPTEAARDSLKAQRLTQEAAATKDPAKAEKLLRDALTADIFFGPAHNNLGTLLLRRGELHGAATEFSWAAKLLPGHPDPRMNLALTMEKAGRTDEALTGYASALEVYQRHIPSLQAITRLQLKTGRATDRTRAMLQEIALNGETQQWREWARMHLTRTSP